MVKKILEDEYICYYIEFGKTNQEIRKKGHRENINNKKENITIIRGFMPINLNSWTKWTFSPQEMEFILGQRDSRASKVFALYSVNPGLTPDIPYGS